ncbi:MAG TPA: hypothetical protein VFR81_05640 [Longimicrobium sp.]|nr:hypothetical protein [Longimicrobium sp.]
MRYDPPPTTSPKGGRGPATPASRQANLDNAERLNAAAEAACAHAREAMEAVLRRRAAHPTPTPEAMRRMDQTVLRLEMAASRREMRRVDRESVRRVRDEERETAELESWVRAQAASMLRDGWTPEELASIGMGARNLGKPPPPRDDGAPR